MKTVFCALVLASACLLPVVAPAADSAPALPIEKAVELANQALADKGAKGVYIQSVALERTSIIGGKIAWVVRWSATVPGLKSGEREWGLRIAMNGNVLHMVHDPASYVAPTSPR